MITSNIRSAYHLLLKVHDHDDDDGDDDDDEEDDGDMI